MEGSLCLISRLNVNCFHAHVLLRCPCMHPSTFGPFKPTVPLVSLQCPSPLLN